MATPKEPTDPKARKLTDKQLAFAYAYVFGADGRPRRNGTQAAIAAGYSAASARGQAVALLTNPNIQRAIAIYETEYAADQAELREFIETRLRQLASRTGKGARPLEALDRLIRIAYPTATATPPGTTPGSPEAATHEDRSQPIDHDALADYERDLQRRASAGGVQPDGPVQPVDQV